MKTSQNVHDLLVQYQKVNQHRLFQAAREVGFDYEKVKQRVDPPAEFVESIPTLSPGFRRPITPMLKARFDYAGKWHNAHAGHDWLSVQDMEVSLRDEQVLDQISARIEIWEESPLVTLASSHVSIFGLHSEQQEEIYLVWPTSPEIEPAVLSYVGNFERRFINLEDYLQYLVNG